MKYDCIVVGTGIAGLSFALDLPAQARVLILSKGRLSEGSTAWAQGGIAAVISPTDSIESHIRDTRIAGAGLCREDQVELLARDGAQAIEWLVAQNARFSSEEDGSFVLALEGGHSVARILNARDATGREISRSLLAMAKSRSNIEIREGVEVLDILTAEDHGQRRCSGIHLWDRRSKKAELHYCPAVFLATGGCGRLFRHSTNPWVSTGDGVAIGLRAGAIVEDMEFIQFHPTGLYGTGSRSFLISEAVRGHGAILRNHLGEAFMESEHMLKDLAPRDIVARGIDRQLKKFDLKHVWLDISHHSQRDLKSVFPNIYSHCLSKGIDMSKDWIPVVPSAHYQCGGIRVDSYSASDVVGLYAGGEVACTGVHGANRLASNSLLEGVVFSRRAAKHFTESQWELKKSDSLPPILSPKELALLPRIQSQLRQLMHEKVGIMRTDHSLSKADLQIENWLLEVENLWGEQIPHQLPVVRNMLTTASSIVKSALARRESRGLHYNLDCPQKSDQLQHHAFAYENGKIIPAEARPR